MEPKNLNNIKWLGHAGFLIKANRKVICIDPYEIADYDKADIILITHSHYDHCSVPDINKMRSPSTIFFTEKESAKSLSGDVRVVKPGDTDLISEMGSFPVDIALLPVSGTYVMTSDEAVEAVKRIKPKAAIPMHYGSIVGSVNDAVNFKKALEGFCEVSILER